ncbi:uncharacterized protein LOC113235027 [Hyposmocoma kahamanoa]|uniref:uncharacterized protein LOC113235027 n=1 Tax=Hyposmocoma kahamanoa TaxID=1477025 RepID=UPI000E6D6623|nr:uncharacterized protein LOC113235027 [Hyposmocoma kahamanoa]
MDPDTIYKALRPVPEFDGNPNVLTRFIRICDQLVINYIKNEAGAELNNLCLLNGILNKITGNAARTINSNGIPESWQGVRNALINNFSDQRDETALYNDLSLLKFTIININDQTKGQPLLITDIPYDYQVNRPMQMPHIKLNSINLKGLNDIEDKILMQQPIKIDHINNQLYHTTIPFYGILLSAAILTSIIIIWRSNLCTRLKIKNPASKDETSTENRINESPEEVEHRSPKSATFSLQVLK